MRNTQLKDDLSTLVEGLAFQRAAETGKAKLSTIYYLIRKAGIEVDLRTIGYIYADVLPLHEDAFDNLADVEKLVGENFRSLTHAIINSTPRVNNKQTGQLAPEQWVARSLARVFYNSRTTVLNNKTEMYKMQEAMLRGARRLTGELTKPIKTQEDFEAIVDRAISHRGLGYTDLSGRLNGIQDLFDATKAEMQKYMDEINNDTTLKPADKAILQGKFAEYQKSLQASVYTLLFSEKEARKVLVDALKEGGFGKQIANGRTIIDWVKLAGETNSGLDIRDNVQKVFENKLDAAGNKKYSQRMINGIKAALEQEFVAMQQEILDRATANLSKRATQATGVRKPNKSDLQKLAELHNLGVFNSAYKVVLNRVLGVNQLSAADMASIEAIGKQVSDLQKEMDAGKLFMSYPFQLMQNEINQIVARNIANKTWLLKAVSALDQFMQVSNAAIISNPANLGENNLSGAREMASMNARIASDMGKEFVGKENEYMKAVWKDISKGGLQYGTDAPKFSHRVSFDERLNHKDPNHSKLKNAARLTAKSIMYISRAFLSASDSAYKAVLHKKAMVLMIHSALLQQGKTKAEANLLINEALYGQKYEDAKVLAKDILTRYGLPNNDNSVIRLANELVLANLETGQLITREMIDAARKSGYDVAGIGLGHEAQNWVGKKIKAIKQSSAREEAELIKKGDYAKLATHRFYEVFVHGMVMRYMGGIYNWISLKLQADTPFSLVAGAINGKWRTEPDLSDRKTMEQTFLDAHAARQRMARSFTGTVFIGAVYGALWAIAQAKKDPDDERSALEQLFAAIKSDYLLMKLFKKMMPSLVVLHSSIDTTADGWEAVLSYLQNFFNLGDRYTIGGKVQEALLQAKRGKTEKAQGVLGTIPGDWVEVPIYRTAKGWYLYGQWAVDHVRGFTGNEDAAASARALQPTFNNPETFFNGLLMGGAVEDFGKFTGWYSRQHPLSAVPGVGAKTKGILEAHGIIDIESLRQSNWQGLRDFKGRLIFNKKERQKVQNYLHSL